MPKPSEIFDTPEAISRVRENEEVVEKLQIFKFNREKENGYRMTHDDYIEFFLSILTTKDQEKEEAIAKARDQEAKLWFETWYSHYISPTKPLTGEFAKFATERIQMTGYERDQALPTEDNK